MLRPYADRPRVIDLSSDVQAPHRHQHVTQPPRAGRLAEQVVRSDAAARQRGVHDPTRPRPKGDMGNPVPVREAQQIARLVARARGVDLHLPAHEQLQVRVSRERDSPGRVGSLDQAGAIDAPLGAPAPQIGRAREPAQRPLRRCEEPRLRSELRFRPDDTGAHTPRPSVRSLDLPVVAQRDARPHGEPETLILELDLGPERAPGGSRGPVLRPCSRTRGQIPGVGPGVVPVARAHAQPHPSLLAPLEQGERLAVQRLAHPVGRDSRLAQERRYRGRDHRRRLVTDGGVREQSNVRRAAGVGRDAPQRSQGFAAGGAPGHALRLDRHLEHAEPRIRYPLARDIRDIALETLGHVHSRAPLARSPNPGISPMPRASRTARSTAIGTARAARASVCRGVAGVAVAVLTANTTSPSNSVPYGTMRRASASPAAWARASRAMRSSVALVATTASVVLRPFPTAPNGAPPRAKCVSASANVPSAARAPARTAPAPSRMLPTAFSTTSAPTTMSPPLAAQLPTPPFMAARGPSAFPTVAPVPAPTDPSTTSAEAAVQAR